MECECQYEASRKSFHDKRVDSKAPNSKYIRRTSELENMWKSRIRNARTETGKLGTKKELTLANSMDEVPKEEKRTYDAIKTYAGTSKRLNDVEASSSKRLVLGSSTITQSSGYSMRSMSTLREDIHGDFNMRKRVMRIAEIEQINEHLRGLEEETYLLKQEFVEAIRERKRLIREVCQQLDGIDGSLLMRSQLAAESSCYTSPDSNDFEDLEDRRSEAGLLQVLFQAANSLTLSEKYRAIDPGVIIPRTPPSNKSSWN